MELVKSWLSFCTPDLPDLPLEFRVFLSQLYFNVAFELDALKTVAPARPAERLSVRKPIPGIAVPVKRENEQHKKLRQILSLSFPDEKIEQTEVRPGVARYKLKRSSDIRVIEYSNLLKDVTPEQVRVFFTDGVAKSKAASAILISSSPVTGTQLIDVFGINVAGNGQVPVIVISSVPIQQNRLGNLVKMANEILDFLQKVNSDEVHFPPSAVQAIFGTMPAIAHSASALMEFIRKNGWILRNAVKDGLLKKGLLPEYSVFSITGGGFVVSRPEGGAITSRTIVRLATIGRSTPREMGKPTYLPVGGSVKRTLTQTRPALTEQTFLIQETRTATTSRLFR